jgi:hypothetical protein
MVLLGMPSPAAEAQGVVFVALPACTPLLHRHQLVPLHQIEVNTSIRVAMPMHASATKSMLCCKVGTDYSIRRLRLSCSRNAVALQLRAMCGARCPSGQPAVNVTALVYSCHAGRFIASSTTCNSALQCMCMESVQSGSKLQAGL